MSDFTENIDIKEGDFIVFFETRLMNVAIGKKYKIELIKKKEGYRENYLIYFFDEFNVLKHTSYNVLGTNFQVYRSK